MRPFAMGSCRLLLLLGLSVLLSSNRLVGAQTDEEVFDVFAPGYSWRQEPGVPTKRHEGCFVMVNQKAYALAGRDIRNVNAYDPRTNTWEVLSKVPIELHHSQCVVVGHEIWLVGAWTGDFPDEDLVENIWVYDTDSDTWDNSRPGIPEDRRRGSTTAVLVERNETREIYVSHGNIGGHNPDAVALAQFDKLNVDTGEWTVLPDAPNARDHAGAGLVGGNLFCVAGGRDSGVDEGSLLKATIATTDCYDLDTGVWMEMPPIPTQRAGASYGTTCDGKLIVAGGEGFGQAFDTVEVFNGIFWATLPPFARARHGSGVVADCECKMLYVASGVGRQGGVPELSTLEIYSDGNSPCMPPVIEDPICAPDYCRGRGLGFFCLLKKYFRCN